MALALDKSRLILQDRQCLFEAGDLCLTPSCPLCVSLWLRNATILDLAVIIEHCTQLCIRSLTVCRVVCHCGILRFGFKCTVLDILVFQSPGDGVFLTHTLVLGLSICFLSFFFRQIGCEVPM